ncbi:MAG: NEL-type E3 ubiquitin ligase domain-containing protein [Pseudomonadota bacterium]
MNDHLLAPELVRSLQSINASEEGPRIDFVPAIALTEEEDIAYARPLGIAVTAWLSDRSEDRDVINTFEKIYDARKKNLDEATGGEQRATAEGSFQYLRGFSRYLDRLPEMASFRNEKTRPSIKNKISHLLHDMARDEKFREEIFQITKSSQTLGRCQDRIQDTHEAVMAYHRNYIANVENWSLERRLRLIHTLWRRDEAQKDAFKLAERVATEGLEVHVAVRNKLRDLFPADVEEEMAHENEAKLDPSDYDAIRRRIGKLEQEDPSQLALYTANHALWKDFLKQTHSEAFDALDEHFNAVGDAAGWGGEHKEWEFKYNEPSAIIPKDTPEPFKPFLQLIRHDGELGRAGIEWIEAREKAHTSLTLALTKHYLDQEAKLRAAMPANQTTIDEHFQHPIPLIDWKNIPAPSFSPPHPLSSPLQPTADSPSAASPAQNVDAAQVVLSSAELERGEHRKQWLSELAHQAVDFTVEEQKLFARLIKNHSTTNLPRKMAEDIPSSAVEGVYLSSIDGNRFPKLLTNGDIFYFSDKYTPSVIKASRSLLGAMAGVLKSGRDYVISIKGKIGHKRTISAVDQSVRGASSRKH